MVDDMGIFKTTVELAPLHDHARRVEIRDVMEDTGSEYTWVPRAVLQAFPERSPPGC